MTIPLAPLRPILLVVTALNATLATVAVGQQGGLFEVVRTQAIGAEEDSLTFDRVAGLVALPTGELIVAEPRYALVRVVDPESLGTRALGGRGGGPGEFHFPRSLGLAGSSLWVFDSGLSRFTVYGPTLEAEHTVRVPPMSGPAVMLSNGDIVGTRMQPHPDSLSGALDILAPDGAVVRGSIAFGQPVRSLRIRSGVVRFDHVQYWSDHTLWAAVPDGHGFVVVERLTSGPAEIRIRWYAPGGAVTWDAALPYEPETIPGSQVRAWAETLSSTILDGLGQIPAVDRRDVSPAAIARPLFVPERLPPVTDILVATTGDLYLRRHPDQGASDVDYWIVGRDGARRTARFPVSFRPMHADAAGVWGVETASDGREFLARYEMSGAGRSD